MTKIIDFLAYVIKHSSGLDTIEYLCDLHHQNR